MFKYVIRLGILVQISIFIGACYKKTSNPEDTNQPPIPKTNYELCKEIKDYDVALAIANDSVVNDQLKARKSVLSGASAEIFLSKSRTAVAGTSAELFDIVSKDKFLGMVGNCEDNPRVDVGCENSEVSIYSNNGNVRNLTWDEFILTSPIIVKSIKFCKAIEVKNNQAVFIYADDMNLALSAFIVNDGGLLSLSAQKIVGVNQMVGLAKASTGVFSVHASIEIKE